MQVAVEILTPLDPDQVARAAEAEYARRDQRALELQALQDQVTRAAQAEYDRAEQARQLEVVEAKLARRRLGRLLEARRRDPFQPYVKPPKFGCGLGDWSE